MYTAMLKMALAEESIQPGKYMVKGHPTMHEFPPEHPNKPTREMEKDEL